MSATLASVPSQVVPESYLKKRKSAEKRKETQAAERLERKKSSKSKRTVIFKRAEKYRKEYTAKERETIRLKRVARNTGNFFVEEEPKLLFVVRLKGVQGIAPKPRKILQLLRLLQINNGVFIRNTKATAQMLRLVEPYVAYGVPNLKTIRTLLYKRGYAKIDRQRIPLSDNNLIEKSLGAKHDLLCMEDIVHEISTVGPAFKQANNFLWPFKLSSPTGGFRGRKFLNFAESPLGDCGNRGEYINQLIQRMA